MIIVDFSQIAYACILQHLVSAKESEINVDSSRRLILNSIGANVRRFKHEYGSTVIACDAPTYWRTESFPQYKYKRKKEREKSSFNWDSIYHSIDTLKGEFRTNMMYKILQVEGCEADDIIAHLSQVYGPSEKIMIISGDKDFAQLLVNPNVHQYSPLLKKQIYDEFPLMTLKQMIIRGDFGDGVPNILSPDDVFVTGRRQKPIMEKKLINWLNTPAEEFCIEGDMLKNYRRNEILIDLRRIPVDVRARIGKEYDDAPTHSRGHFLHYLASSGLKELTANIENF